MEAMDDALRQAIEQDRLEKLAVIRRKVIDSHTKVEVIKPTRVEITLDKETMLPMLARVWYHDTEVYQNLVTKNRLSKAQYDQLKARFKDSSFDYLECVLHKDD